MFFLNICTEFRKPGGEEKACKFLAELSQVLMQFYVTSLDRNNKVVIKCTCFFNFKQIPRCQQMDCLYSKSFFMGKQSLSRCECAWQAASVIEGVPKIFLTLNLEVYRLMETTTISIGN